MQVLQKLWNDDNGFVVSTELILLGTVAVFGLMVGMTSVRDGVVSELSDVAGAVQDVNQSYSIDGVTGHNAATAGSAFIDDLDECDSADDAAGDADNCITFDGGPDDDEGAAININTRRN